MHKISGFIFSLILIVNTGFSQIKPNGQITPNDALNVNPLPTPYSFSILTNYVRSWDVKMPSNNLLDIIESSQIKDVVQSTTYSDGMGRELQSVRKQITPNGKDVVTPKIYDNEGRSVFNYLEYPSASSDGKIKLNAFSEQASYMLAQPQYSGEQIFYSKTVYDNSPISNVEKVLGVGNSWAGSDRGSSMKYELNGVNEIYKWNVGFQINSQPSTAGYYDPSSLYRGIEIDVNNKRVVSYKDKEGKIILKKVEVDVNSGAIMNSYIGWLSTYYIYDDVSNLRYTITPKAVEWLVSNNWTQLTATIINELCFRYEYDDKGRLITTKSPGAEEVNSVYDARDRVVLFRDGNMFTNEQWQYTLYDELNRVTEKGLWFNTQTRDVHQLSAENSLSYPKNNLINNESLEFLYYDDYDFIQGNNFSIPSVFDQSQLNGNWLNIQPPTQFPYPLSLTQTQQTLNLKVVSRVKVLGSNPAQYLYTVLFYDKYGNVIQSISSNISGGKDIVTTQYGFGGKILSSHLQHTFIGTTGTQLQNIYSRFEYDDAGRLLKTFKRVNNDIEKIQTNNFYNEQSQLTKVELGKNSNNNPIETIDYTYNLSGSLKGMNEKFVDGTTNDRFFGENLYRDYGFTNVQYNGSISGIQWRSIGDGERRAFGYNYDPANRLLNSQYTQYTNGSWNNSTADFTMTMGDGINPSTAYDENGNIKSVSQSTLQLYQSAIVDNLQYQYLSNNYSNRLYTVTESATAGTPRNATENVAGDFKDNDNGTPSHDYLYDPNGNTTADYNKGITSIAYNYLDKPTVIQITGKGKITYVYDASGERLKKIIEPLVGNMITYTYIGGFTYKDQNLQYFYSEDGRIRPTVSQSGTPGWAYDYFVKDHLGNIRVVLTDEVQTNFYPKAQLENTTIANEATYYDRTNIGLTTRPGPFGNVNDNGNVVQLLRKNTNSIGISRLLKVMVKDKINVTVDYYFPSETVDNSGANGTNSLVNVITNLFTLPGAPTAFLNKGVEIGQQLNGSFPLGSFLSPQNANQPGTTPKAFLNILFFDEQFKFVSQSSEIVGVSIAGSLQQIIRTNIDVPKNGYVYVYVSNESNNLVYFDNFQVSHVRGPLLEENHYNSFGAKIYALCSKSLSGIYNSLGYQSKELDEEFDLDWADFSARNYDAQIGRFMQQDPAEQFTSGYIGMGNNWVMGTDPDGKFFWLVGAAIGAVINVVTNLENIHGLKDFIGFAGVGAVSGALASVGQFAAAGAVSSIGNALLGGVRDPGELIKQGMIGAASSVVGGKIGEKLTSVISTNLSRVVGSEATKIISNISGSAITGGVFGAGFAVASGGNPWQGFLQGLKSGAISGTISTLVPMGINKIKESRPPPPPEDQPLKPNYGKVELLKTEIKELPPSKVEFKFSDKNGRDHWLKHARGLKYKAGELSVHPDKIKTGPDMPRQMRLREYKEGASKFFGTSDAGTASFISPKDGRLYMYNSGTNLFGVANPKSGFIYTWYKPQTGQTYWNNKIITHSR